MTPLLVSCVHPREADQGGLVRQRKAPTSLVQPAASPGGGARFPRTGDSPNLAAAAPRRLPVSHFRVQITKRVVWMLWKMHVPPKRAGVVVKRKTKNDPRSATTLSGCEPAGHPSHVAPKSVSSSYTFASRYPRHPLTTDNLLHPLITVSTRCPLNNISRPCPPEDNKILKSISQHMHIRSNRLR